MIYLKNSWKTVAMFLVGLQSVWALAASAHFEADGLVVESGNQVIVHVWQGAVTGSLQVPLLAMSDTFVVTFLDPDSVRFQPTDPDTWLKNIIGAPGTVSFDSLGQWSFGLTGNTAGTISNIRLRLWFLDHYDFTSPPIAYVVSTTTGVRAPLAVRGPLLELFPNPVSVRGEVRYILQRPGPVDLTLYDVAGRRLFSVDRTGERGIGEHRAFLDVGNLPSGVYFLRLQSPQGTTVRKVHVVQ